MSIENFQIDGLLALVKPRGMISKDVSRHLQKRFGRLKIGHVGTLDPSAEGVLPILLGRATRLQDYLLDHPKTYEFLVNFGHETDSLDDDGEIVAEVSKKRVERAEVERVIPQFVGRIKQEPPLYSAIKVAGKPLYYYARSGTPLPDSTSMASLSRMVHIHSLDLISFEPQRIKLRARCSKGTFVRCIARDIARSLSTLATTSEITRTQAAGISIEECLSLDHILSTELEKCVRPMRSLSWGLPQLTLNDTPSIRKVMNGQKLVVRPEYFAKALVQSPTICGGEEFSEGPVILKDDLGSSIGIGSVQLAANGSVLLQLKRNLL